MPSSAHNQGGSAPSNSANKLRRDDHPYALHPWKIVETSFRPEMQKASESLFSLGNGRMGQRANFEEGYSGSTLLGNYVAGVYYPDKTRVGWWKIGYPEYFAKVPNAANWTRIIPSVDGEALDLAMAETSDFYRELDMKEGVLRRSFNAWLKNGKKIRVEAERFISLVDDEAAAIKYTVKPLNFSGEVAFRVLVDGDVRNEDANYDERFWDETERGQGGDKDTLTMKIRKTGFVVCTGQKTEVFKSGKRLEVPMQLISATRLVGRGFTVNLDEGQSVEVVKYVVNVSSMNHPVGQLQNSANQTLDLVSAKGYEDMLGEHKAAWEKRWVDSDIEIKGDLKAQQAIRFNIFHLNQTYTGADARLNIGPKGFTGEKYGGSTYWDTEAYCLPYYMLTAGSEVAKNLLRYRYNHLDKAIENAEKLGFTDGAALYPMVTMNGEECHNEWEITFEEIHRNGAMAYAIFNYIRHTGDANYLKEGGLEQLVALCRFWSQRTHRSPATGKFVILGVTGPNEYENNVNNNWYTNYIARWTLAYTLECLVNLKDDAFLEGLIKKTRLDMDGEGARWREIIADIYLPTIDGTRVFMQQDGFLDKEDLTVDDLDPMQRPLNKHWSWDRILRSIYIKQADVLQGLYFFEEKFDRDTLRENFDYYEARTVHESSLSPCVHAILAASLGRGDKAYEMYLRTARLDLDDYNHEVDEGLHITSMAGTWMAVVEGFAGKRVTDGLLCFRPSLPAEWESYRFNILYRNTALQVWTGPGETVLTHRGGPAMDVGVFDEKHRLPVGGEIRVKR